MICTRQPMGIHGMLQTPDCLPCYCCPTPGVYFAACLPHTPQSCTQLFHNCYSRGCPWLSHPLPCLQESDLGKQHSDCPPSSYLRSHFQNSAQASQIAALPVNIREDKVLSRNQGLHSGDFKMLKEDFVHFLIPLRCHPFQPVEQALSHPATCFVRGTMYLCKLFLHTKGEVPLFFPGYLSQKASSHPSQNTRHMS